MKPTRFPQLYKSVAEQMDQIVTKYLEAPMIHRVNSSMKVITLPTGDHYAVDIEAALNGTFNWPTVAMAESYVSAGRPPPTRAEVYQAIDSECDYQDDKFGKGKEQSVPGYLVLIRNELREAELGWAKDAQGRNSVMHEIRQIAALCVKAMETYGTVGNATSTNDIPD